MADILIKGKSANYIEDEVKFNNADSKLNITYYREDGTFHFILDIGTDDHFVTLDLDADDLLKAIKEALLQPEN